MIPSANTANRVRAPPANRFRKFRMFVVPRPWIASWI